MIGYQNNGNKIKILNAKDYDEFQRAEKHFLDLIFSTIQLDYRILEQIVDIKKDGRVVDNVLLYTQENRVYDFEFEFGTTGGI